MKKILPILLVLFMTGCTVNYDITIKENNIKEEISISEDVTKVNERITDYEVENAYSEFNNKTKRKYNSSKEKKNNTLTYNLTQNYIITDKLYIRAFSECFDSYVIDTNDKDYNIIRTSRGFKCLSYNYNNIDQVNVNIKIDQKVLDSNADSIKGNTYTWNFNNTNSKDKSIYLKYKKPAEKKKKTSMLDEIKKSLKINTEILIAVTVLVIIIIFGSIAYVIARVINKNQNKL